MFAVGTAVSEPGGFQLVVLAGVPGSGTSRSFAVSAEGQSEVEARVSDSAGGSATATATVKIDNSKPTTKAFRATVDKGKRVRLAYRVDDPPAGCGRATVTLKMFKGSKLRVTIKIKTVSACNVRKTQSWRCTLPEGTYTLKVYATDIAGNAQSRVGRARVTVR